MQTILAIGTYNPAQLMDELITRLPMFRRVTNQEADFDMGQVRGRADEVTVEFADDIDSALVQAVIDVHVPDPPPIPRDYKAELRAASNLAELKTVLEDVLGL